MGNTCWRENTRIWSFDVCTNSSRYLCKSSWQSASPHYLSANRGHAEKKTVETETKGFVKKAEVGKWRSSECSGFMQTGRANPPVASSPQTAHSWFPGHHLASMEPPMMDTAGSRYFWQKIYQKKKKMEIPAVVASTRSVPQSRVAFAKKEGR